MAINANAQLSIGVRGGYNHANVHLTEGLDNLTPDVKAIDAYSVAAVVEMPLGHGFSFQPELAYTQKGFRMAEGFEFELFNFPIPVDVEAESRFNYLEAPLLFKYELGDGKVRAYVTGGPSFGYATSGRLRTFTNLLVEIKLLDTNIDLESIDYQRFEVAAVAGAGLKVDAGRIQIFADARYQHGFTELYDIPVLDERIRNKGFGVNAGVLVPLKPW
jgi:hypothetical protein